MFVCHIQTEGTLDQVVQARVEGKADVQDLLMEYCKHRRKRDSSISKEQVDFMLSRERQGGFCCIAYGKNAATAIVEWLYKGKPLD